MQQVIPVIRILDVEKAKEFYLGWLGFTMDWEHRFGENFPLYCQVSKAGLQLHLTEHYGDCIPGSCVRIFWKDVRTWQKELREKDYRYYKPGLQSKEWGTIELSLLDPFGNHLIFFEPVTKTADAE